MEEWTIKKLLDWVTEYLGKSNVDSPRLSAELLLSHITGLQRIELYTNFNRVLPKDKLDLLHGLVKRCAAQEPVQYLVGKTEFYSMQIKVSRDCLIPRPETELLVERAIDFLRSRQGVQMVCDLCTGSGCIAAAIAKNQPDVVITATDICDRALAIAAENVEHHKLTEKVNLLCGDLFAPIIEGMDQTKFDLVVSNPPYVSAAEFDKLEARVKDYEPKGALFAGDEGLDIYKRIADRVGDHLKDDGTLILEIGYAQGDAVKELLESTGLFAEIVVEKDFSNNDRVVTAKKVSS
ncbi:MAG: peptide chain release factor N(5)-glutamine methyltransferase [Sedimentisphaerales bacterium]|nr:peptide chain release factor N(5)-glutamine methyltransferase [Sedimentisphaerales bacterium]